MYLCITDTENKITHALKINCFFAMHQLVLFLFKGKLNKKVRYRRQTALQHGQTLVKIGLSAVWKAYI